MTRPLTPGNRTSAGSDWSWKDGLLVLGLVAFVALVMHTAEQFTGPYQSAPIIETRLVLLPGYTAQSLLRLTLAYGLALLFSLVYSTITYRSRRVGQFLLPLLDILQSIPVLSFLPGVVLALIAIFPGQRIGVEIAAVLLIFTGMTWNMTFSFYQSLCSIPRELREAAAIYHLNGWQRFWSLELPSGTIGLVWNSVMSVAGGWFFLMAIESFRLGDQDFRLPGLGSFLTAAANQGDGSALMWGLGVLITVIVLTDLLIWQPLIAWAEKFKLQMQETGEGPSSRVLDFLRRSPLVRVWNERIWDPFQESMTLTMNRFFPSRSVRRDVSPSTHWIPRLELVVGVPLGGLILWGLVEFLTELLSLSLVDWQRILVGGCFTTLRVMAALVLSLLWTVPVGVMIGRNPRLAQVLQPIAQIAASVPATAMFPVLLLTLSQLGGGLELGSIALMMLGTMWYLLFNVIAGAQAIPSELFEVARVYKLTWQRRWQTLILPGIFPYLITGIITAVGGAWNASIVSEYVHFQGKTEATLGLGAIISEASANGNFPLLLASTAIMAVMVVLNNRLLWQRLYRLANEKYQQL